MLFSRQNDGKVTDFLSFYTLPSTIMNHPVHRSLKAAYSFYNVHTTTPLLDLMSDALILAKSVCVHLQATCVLSELFADSELMYLFFLFILLHRKGLMSSMHWI